jgi:hypothetical protein
MWFRAGVLAVLIGPAQAQISPTGPPHDAPPAETMLPKAAQSEDEARQQFTAGGYSTVHNLARSSEGGWSATAVVNGRRFSIHLNSAGEIERRD